MIASSCAGLLIIKPKNLRANRGFLQLARGIMAGAPGQPFFVVLKKVSEKQVIISKNVLKAQTLDRPQLATPTKVILSESEPDTVAAVHYEPSADRYMKMSRHEAVERHGHEKLKHKWQEEVQL